ncbi:MAG: thioesterase domain-containing protein [Snowella sp.]|nr:thioesterase domain-containing protein [Snowella sp.]
MFGIHDDQYKWLLQYLGNEQPFYFLHYGLAAKKNDSDARGNFSVEELATHYCQEIERFYSEGPYQLIGYCGGGLIAYEIARQLVEKGKSVKLLVMCESYPGGLWKKLSLYQAILFFIRLSWPDKKIRITNIFFNKNTIFKDLTRKTPSFYHSFEPSFYQGSVIFFEALNKYADRICYLNASAENWRQLIKGKFDIYKIPGDHISILNDPDNAKIVANILKPRLSGNDGDKKN